MLLGGGDGTFRPARYLRGRSTSAREVVAGDFNGDGRLDLAVADAGGQPPSACSRGNGDGTFQAASTYIVGGQDPTSIAAGDFRGTGQLDLVTANFTFGNNTASSVSVLEADGDAPGRPEHRRRRQRP